MLSGTVSSGFTKWVDTPLKETVESHLGLVLSRYRNLVSKTEVMLSKEKEDGMNIKKCAVAVRLAGSGSILVQESDADIYNAVQYCMTRMHRSLNRHLGRRQRMLSRQSRLTATPIEAAQR